MINSIKNIYKSEDLHGEFLLQPLKSYRSFFAHKIDHSSGLTRLATIISHVVTGIFAYPLFAALAGVGMIIKGLGIPALRNHNQYQKACVACTCNGIKVSNGFSDNSASSIYQTGWEMRIVREFKITKQKALSFSKHIQDEIDFFSSQYRRVYVACSGSIQGETEEIVLHLRTLERKGQTH